MKKPRPSLAYPFVTRRQVVARLGRDPEFAGACLAILHRRFVDRDILPPPAGWMASDVKRAEELYSRLDAGEASPSDLALATKLAQRYARQIASHFRDDELARNPSLKPLAAIYGLRPTVEDADIDDGVDEDPPTDEAEAPEHLPARVTEPPPAALEEAAPPPRRRGRPKGSKNKPKPAAAAQPGQRRRSR
jgi:hypothetical protein